MNGRRRKGLEEMPVIYVLPIYHFPFPCTPLRTLPNPARGLGSAVSFSSGSGPSPADMVPGALWVKNHRPPR